MRSSFTIAVLSLLSLVAFTESVNAGWLFGRIWERRRAELYSDLSSQVTYEVHSGVASAEQRLSTDLTARVQAEGKKLDEFVKLEMAKLQKQAQDQVAAEAKRLQSRVDSEVAKLRSAAETAVASESKKLQDALALSTKTLRDEADKKLQEVVAKFDADMNAGMKKLQESAAAVAATAATEAKAATDGQIEKLRTEVKELVRLEIAAALPKPVEPAPEQAPEKKKDAPPKETPVGTTAPEIKQEKKDGETVQ